LPLRGQRTLASDAPGSPWRRNRQWFCASQVCEFSTGSSDGPQPLARGRRPRALRHGGRLLGGDQRRAAVHGPNRRIDLDTGPDACTVAPGRGRLSPDRLSRSAPGPGSNPRARCQPTTLLLRPIGPDVPGDRRRGGGRMRPRSGCACLAVVSADRIPHSATDGGLLAGVAGRCVGGRSRTGKRRAEARKPLLRDDGDSGGTRLRVGPSTRHPRSDCAGDRPLRRSGSVGVQGRRRARTWFPTPDAGGGRARLPRSVRC
jgi:hypothetical protein